eukprot:189706-Chlamydomonas_euryale.AAC.1
MPARWAAQRRRARQRPWAPSSCALPAPGPARARTRRQTRVDLVERVEQEEEHRAARRDVAVLVACLIDRQLSLLGLGDLRVEGGMRGMGGDKEIVWERVEAGMRGMGGDKEIVWERVEGGMRGMGGDKEIMWDQVCVRG